MRRKRVAGVLVSGPVKPVNQPTVLNPARVPINSPMYGSLAMLHVEDGVEVVAGEKLCDIEAMKNFYSVEATVSGTLQWSAKIGEVVAEDEILGWIAPTGDK